MLQTNSVKGGAIPTYDGIASKELNELVEILLRRDPAQRAMMETLLSHPFLMKGKSVVYFR